MERVKLLETMLAILHSLFSSVYTVAMGAVLAAVCFLLAKNRRRRRAGEPPLEQGWIPYLGLALEYHKNPLHCLRSRQKKYGDVFTLKIFGRYMTFIMDPFQYSNVSKQSKYLDFSLFADQLASKAFGYPNPSDSKYSQLSDNLHKVYKSLQGEKLTDLTDSMMGNLRHVLKRKLSQEAGWREEKMYEFSGSVMFEASFMTLYGKTSEPDGHKSISELRDKFSTFDAMFPYLFIRVPIAFFRATNKARESLIQACFPEKLSKLSKPSHVIQYRQSVLEACEELQERDKAAHHFGFLWAAVGNTIPATFWAMYYLVSHPEALAAVRDQLDHLLKSTGQTRGPEFDIQLTKEQLNSLFYLDSVLNESFRLSVASMNLRVVLEDFILKLEENQDVSLRKGDMLILYPQSLHYDPDVYSDPEVFKFDRFVENGVEKTNFYKNGRRLKNYLLPFGSGSFMCPGRFFAMNEIKQYLALLVTYFDMEITENKTLGLDNSRSGLGALLPDSDIRFKFKPRA